MTNIVKIKTLLISTARSDRQTVKLDGRKTDGWIDGPPRLKLNYEVEPGILRGRTGHIARGTGHIASENRAYYEEEPGINGHTNLKAAVGNLVNWFRLISTLQHPRIQYVNYLSLHLSGVH